MASKCEVPYLKDVAVCPLCSPDVQKVHYENGQRDGCWHISALKALGKVKPVYMRGVLLQMGRLRQHSIWRCALLQL